MTDAVRVITDRVRARARSRDRGAAASPGRAGAGAVPPGERSEAMRRLVRDEIRRYSERALAGVASPLTDEAAVERSVLAAVAGFGPLQPYFDDPEVEEIWINRGDRVFVARGGVSELTPTVLTQGQVRDLVERMLQSTGRRVDHASPFVDASLPDGSRLHVVIPDITREWAVNIRKFRRAVRDLPSLVEAGTLSPEAAGFLRRAVLSGMNILVSGATQSGKTTMLSALLAAADPGDRIVTVEETFELDVRADDAVALQCRQPSLEGHGEITLRRLIKEALRMRPDRLVVGEVREAESLDLLIALNSGLPGACTLHANSATEALQKLCTLPLLAGGNIPADFIVPTVARSIDLQVHCRLEPSGARRVTEISATTGEFDGGVIETVPLFVRSGDELVATGRSLPRTEEPAAAGLEVEPRPIRSPTAAVIA